MNQSIAEMYAADPVKALRLALRRTARIGWKKRMDAINDLIGGHGVEAIRGDWKNGYWCDIVATFINIGDTYDPTIIHVRGESAWDDAGRFTITSVGDFVERNSRRLGIL